MMSTGFTDAFAKDPVGELDRLFRMVADRYERWLRSGRMTQRFARKRVSLGTVNRRVLQSIQRKIDNGEEINGSLVEAVAMRSIYDKLSELNRQEQRRGDDGRMPQLSQLATPSSERAIEPVNPVQLTEQDPAELASRSEILQAVRALFVDPELNEQEAMLLRHLFVHQKTKAAADHAGIPHSTAKRKFRELFAKLRRHFGDLEDALEA